MRPIAGGLLVNDQVPQPLHVIRRDLGLVGWPGVLGCGGVEAGSDRAHLGRRERCDAAGQRSDRCEAFERAESHRGSVTLTPSPVGSLRTKIRVTIDIPRGVSIGGSTGPPEGGGEGG